MLDHIAYQRPRFHALALSMAERLLAEAQHTPTRCLDEKVDRLLDWASRTAPSCAAAAAPPLPERAVEGDPFEDAA